MRFTYSETMTDPSYYLPLARAAEAAGYHAFAVPDSLCYPQNSDSRYPFTPDGSREFLEDKPILDPFALIAAMGAVTTTLRFSTFVLKLPIRNPVLTAKQASSVAVLTGCRLDLGVGISPWPDDFAICGVPWERRGQRMDESMEILRALLGGGFVRYTGECYDLPAIKISPVPDVPLRLLVGGHSEAALKRAARFGDGWMHAGGEADQLAGLLTALAFWCKEYGRETETFSRTVISLDAFTVDGVRRLEDLGVTDVIVGFRWPYVTGPDTEPLQRKIDSMHKFADTVIHAGL